MTSKLGKIPRSVPPLVLLCVLASLALLLINNRQSPDADFVLGGPLFPLQAKEVTGFSITSQGNQHNFDKAADGYWMQSGTGEDHLDQAMMEIIVGQLVKAQGGRLLPGSTIEDRRYDFHGPTSLRVSVFDINNREYELALGTVNPISGNYYASGAGRSKSFSVGPGFRQLITKLPNSARLPQLLPEYEMDKVQEIHLTNGNSQYHLLKTDGRWWLRCQDGRTEAPFLAARKYNQIYQSRVKTNSEGTWFLANTRQVTNMMHDVSAIIVRDVIPTHLTQARLREWDLQKPMWTVRFVGDNLYRQSEDPKDNALEISLGLTLDGSIVPAIRLGNVVTTDVESIVTLEQTPSILIDTRALAFDMAEVDSFHLDSVDRPLMWAHKAEGSLARTIKWMGHRPPGLAFRVVDHRTGKQANSVGVDLDRLPIKAVLPPTMDQDILHDDSRVFVTAYITDQNGAQSAGGARIVSLQLGSLNLDNLPAEANLAPVGPNETREAALWNPSTGELLQVPDDMIMTGRSLLNNYVTAR